MKSSMLTSAALAAVLCGPSLVVAQEATAAEPAQEAAAPVVTDAKALAFLEIASESIYKPERHGLEALSFDMGLPTPDGSGELAVLHCSWKKGEAPTVTSELNLEAIPEAQRAMVQAQAAGIEQGGYEYLALQLNTVLDNNLERMVATLRGLEDGLIAVEWAAKPDSGLPPVKQTYFFNDDNHWVKTEGVVAMQGQELANVEKLEWVAVDGGEEYVQKSITSEMTMPFGVIKQTTTFNRDVIGGFNLVTGLTQAIAMPGVPEMTISFRNFVVNGEAQVEG